MTFRIRQPRVRNSGFERLTFPMRARGAKIPILKDQACAKPAASVAAACTAPIHDRLLSHFPQTWPGDREVSRQCVANPAESPSWSQPAASGS